MPTANAPMSIPTVDDIRALLCAATFGGPLISNIYRGLVAEVIVGAALDPEWQLCSGDWRGWDFEHPSGLRLEVKQSAARQTWTGTRKATTSIFDIRVRIGSPIPDASPISMSLRIIRSPTKAQTTAILANGGSTWSRPVPSRLAKRSAWRR